VRRITGDLAGIAAAALGEATTVLHNARRALRRATGQRKAQLYRAINHLHARMGRTHVPAQGLLRSEPLTWADHARAEPRVVAFRRIPRHQWARVRAWDGHLLQRIGAGKLLSREHMEEVRVSQGGFDIDVCLGPRVAEHGWGVGYMLNQRGLVRPNLEDLRSWPLRRFLCLR
jgi:hypothetical protein